MILLTSKWLSTTFTGFEKCSQNWDCVEMIWEGSNILRGSPHELASLIPPLLNWQSFHQPNWVKRRSVIEMRRNLLVTMMVNEDEWGGRVCKDNYLWLMMTTWRRLLRTENQHGGEISLVQATKTAGSIVRTKRLIWDKSYLQTNTNTNMYTETNTFEQHWSTNVYSGIVILCLLTSSS